MVPTYLEPNVIYRNLEVSPSPPGRTLLAPCVPRPLPPEFLPNARVPSSVWFGSADAYFGASKLLSPTGHPPLPMALAIPIVSVTARLGEHE